MKIYSDASDTGWGATNCLDSIFRFWDSEQRSFSINYRELLASKFGLYKLAHKTNNCQILLRIDNTTAISYINKMGGIRFHKYYKLTKEIWQWVEERHNFLVASYIASSENEEADRLSRLNNDDTEWESCNYAFNQIVEKFGCPEVDLFANKLNTKCKQFFSWMPDSKALNIDAFTVRWTNLKFYAFPPFSLILKPLVKIKPEGA